MSTDYKRIEDLIFNRCQEINELLVEGNEIKARDKLIQLLDFHKKNQIVYTELVNHLIREVGLFPYLDEDNSDWEDRYVCSLFKADVGFKENLPLHREQSLLLKKLLQGSNIAVSAPTSFGKSFVVDAYIKIKQPKNVMIIVPTIALTDETRRRIYKKFANDYKIITTAEAEIADKNIFIFPQERAINYVNKVEYFDILIIDEFYKASSNFEPDRSPSLIKAMIKIGQKSRQRYYLAPNISNLESNPFTQDMEFLKLNFNTVFLRQYELYKEIGKDSELKGNKLVEITKREKGKTLIYAGTYSNIEIISTLLLTSFDEQENNLLNQFSDWLGRNYDYNWQLTKLVKRGVGIHNGRLHRSLSQIQVKLFEEENGLNKLVSTSSIIEGINTSAENVIIWMNKNGQKKLNDFTYKNVIGRAGRMFKYFIGNIFILAQPPANVQAQLGIPFPEIILGDLDFQQHETYLTKEQIAKIKVYDYEMSEIFGYQTYHRLKAESAFQSSDSELIKSIAVDMANNPDSWKGLAFLNQQKPSEWDSSLYKIINLQPGNWDTTNRKFVNFIKVLSRNWFLSIPELLIKLEQYDIGLDEFFNLERNVTFKFASILKDVNTLQKEILRNRVDISRFISWVTFAFMPPVAFQLEEYGLPRMITKKVHKSKIIDFYDRELTIHRTIDIFKEIGKEQLCNSIEIDNFDRYIIDYFYDGITTN